MKGMSNDGTTMVSPRVTPRRVAYDVVKGSSSNYGVANEKISCHQVFEHVEQPVGDQFCIGDDRQPQKINGELTTLVAPLNHDFTVITCKNWSPTGRKLVVGSVRLGYKQNHFCGCYITL